MVIFDKAPEALKGVLSLKNLDRAGDIRLYATAVITKDSTGTVSIKQASEREANGVLLGLLAGILMGAFGGPVGLAIGASIGSLSGLIFDLAKVGISAGFLEEAAHALARGQVALLAEIDETTTTPVNRTLVKLGGHVYRRQRSEFVEAQIMEELDRINAELKPH